MSVFPDKFREVYEEYYQLHPDAAALPPTKLYYLHRQWIFPNHIDVMLDLVEIFHDRFYPQSEKEVALFAALLHDAGLVYERTERSPAGHENRSVEYAELILRKHGFDDTFIKKVCAAIESTEPEVEPASDEAIIVRNADAYSQLSSVHFIAKAYFSDDLKWYINWFGKKIHGSLKKLTIPELITEKSQLVTQYEGLLSVYRKHQESRYIDR